MSHPFFEEIKRYSDLKPHINFEIVDLPKPYKGQNRIKAIILGADPTNNGIKTDKGLKQLNTVFGIGSEYEVDFFKPQLINLKALTLDKNDLFIQNFCRNYFTTQTGQNPKWNKIAELWIQYFKNEIERFENIPILVTAEKIFLTKYRNKLIKEGIITDSVNITTYQGTISDIKWREESIPSINFKYVLKIKLKGKNDTFDFVFSEDELKMTQTTKIENTDEKKADIKDLRPGDDITIIWTTNANKSGIFRETKNIKIIIN